MKELLLAKSNIRKAKGLTIGLILLIILAACFFNIVLIIFTDYNSNAEKSAEKLNSGNAQVMLRGEVSGIKNDDIKKYINDDVKDYEISNQVSIMCNTKYGNGTVSPVVTFTTEKEAFNCKIGKNEIIKKDDSIKNNFIYLPNQYHTGGKFDVGEDYELKIADKTYNLKIKGFIENSLMGSYNVRTIQVILSDEIYDELLNNSEMPIKALIIKFVLKDEVNSSKFVNKISDEILTDYPTIETDVITKENAIFSRTFTSIIFGVSFLVISFIIILIVFLMLSNNISNYIRENMRIIGAIKALGYTNKNIKASFLIQFSLISSIGCIGGVALSYVLAPVIANIMTAQAGIPYMVTFNILTTLITIITLMLIVILTVLFFLRKTSKIEPITALRDGMVTHNFKKNRIKLENSKLSLNISLALKTTLTNMKQNIATLVIVFFLVFMGVVSLALYQNFSVNIKISLLTFEVCDGAILTDDDKDDEVYNYIKNMDNVKNPRLVSNVKFNIEDARLYGYIIDDAQKLNNQDMCYDGRLPKYDNEIALSGKFCKSYNYNIGDQVEVVQGGKSEKFIITGLIQTANNSGQEGVLLKKGLEKIIGDNYPKFYYFDVNDGADVDKVIEDIEAKFGDRVKSTLNFEEVVEGSSQVFKLIAGAMVVMVLIISAFVILLVLYLLIKTLINNKKKDYGILKAVGYTSKDIILQNAISFMPTIIISVVSSCIASTFLVNPYIGMIMSMFGIMKLTLDIPVNLVVIMGIGFVVVSFVFALLLSRRIKKIEPYKLLTEE